MFTPQQLEFIRALGIDTQSPISDENYIEIEDKVSEYLQLYGFDEHYEPTAEGIMCESILDAIP